MKIESASRLQCTELDVSYWKDAILGPKKRGSKVRVIPHKSMLGEYGYLKKVRVMGEEIDVLFDELYIDHYFAVTGIDHRIQWRLSDQSEESDIIPVHEFAISTEEMISNFLNDGKIILSDKNPRHALFIKFQKYIGELSNDDC